MIDYILLATQLVILTNSTRRYFCLVHNVYFLGTCWGIHKNM